MTDLTALMLAIAEPKRREILAHLARGDASVSELSKVVGLGQPSVSYHLRILENAGLIVRFRVAQTRPVRLNPDGLKAIAYWLQDFERFLQ
jgi:DNA-binding transcriptional ArsR family regulator